MAITRNRLRQIIKEELTKEAGGFVTGKGLASRVHSGEAPSNAQLDMAVFDDEDSEEDLARRADLNRRTGYRYPDADTDTDEEPVINADLNRRTGYRYEDEEMSTPEDTQAALEYFLARYSEDDLKRALAWLGAHPNASPSPHKVAAAEDDFGYDDPYSYVNQDEL